MSQEHSVDEIVTYFLLNTCRLCPQLTSHHEQAVRHCVETAMKHPSHDAEADFIPLTTGSVAEFYIEPMLPLCGDIDVMFHLSTELAIPRGHPPPTQLPPEFHNYVHVFEIVDSHSPGYVYLELRYFLKECTEDKKYACNEYKGWTHLGNHFWHGEDLCIHGPARVLGNFGYAPMFSTDQVSCLRCLSWLPQAADWPKRHRNYDWPESATVDRVVNNGCDVVGVAHHECKKDEWISKRQWRLSFSRAEIVLINSWIPVQQIIYHMLRVFVKTERLTDSSNTSEVFEFSNYHIKTLMLWACELKSSSFWNGDLNFIKNMCRTVAHFVCLAY